MVTLTPAEAVTLTWEWDAARGWPARVTGDLPRSDRPHVPDPNRARTVEPERVSVTVEGPPAEGYTLARVTVTGARVLTSGSVSWTSTAVQWDGDPYSSPVSWLPDWLRPYVEMAVRAANWHESDAEWRAEGSRDA